MLVKRNSRLSITSKDTEREPPGYVTRAPSISLLPEYVNRASTSRLSNTQPGVPSSSMEFIAEPPAEAAPTAVSPESMSWSPDELYISDPSPAIPGVEPHFHSSGAAVHRFHNTSSSSSGSSATSISEYATSIASTILALSDVSHASIQPGPYSFIPYDCNTMCVAQFHADPDGRISNVIHAYHVSYRMNALNPTSCVTVVRRRDERGEIVGDFQMGPPGTILMRGSESKLHSWVLTRERNVVKPAQKLWHWNYVSAPLRWDCTKFPFVCRLKDRSQIIAKFCVTPQLRQAGYPESSSQLEVLPGGLQYFDDILMSILVLERKRLSSGAGDAQSHPFKASDPVPWLWE